MTRKKTPMSNFKVLKGKRIPKNANNSTCEEGGVSFASFASFASLEDLSISLLPMAQMHHHLTTSSNHPTMQVNTWQVKVRKHFKISRFRFTGCLHDKRFYFLLQIIPFFLIRKRILIINCL